MTAPLPAAPAAASVRLTVNRRVGTAPAGFFFSALAEGFGVDDPYFDVRYRWDFGDPGHYTRHDTEDLPWGKYYDVDGAVTLVEDGAVPEGTDVAFLGNDGNVAYGPHVCHVFERPGEYAVTCEVRKRGQAPVRATMSVLVENPEIHFAGPATICVSPSGDFAGAPARALWVGSYAEAVKLARRAPSEDVRILFRRGERHEIPGGRGPSRKQSWRRLHWGAFGDGAPPVYGPHGLSLEARPDGEACAWGLDYEGPYRADDPWGSGPVSDALHSRGRAFTTVWDCGMRGGSNLITVSARGADIVVGNTFGTDWHNYGMFANRGIARVGLCGVWLKQNPRAVIGDDGKGEKEPPFHQDHAPFRCSALGGPVAFNLCDLRSVGSWAGHYQPCLRIGRSPNGEGPLIEEAVMDRLRGENGGMLGTGNSGRVAYPRRYLWDKIYLVLMPEGPDVFNPMVSGLHYRNVVVVIPDVPKVAGNMTKWILRGEAEKDAVDRPEIARFGVTLMNSTLVDLRSYHTMMFDTERMEADYGFVRIANNVVYAPNKDEPSETHDAPLDETVLWRVTNPGMRYRDDPFAPIFAPAPDAAAYYRPLPASPAFADAGGEAVAVDDFFGRVRGAATSRGAIDSAQ